MYCVRGHGIKFKLAVHRVLNYIIRQGKMQIEMLIKLSMCAHQKNKKKLMRLVVMTRISAAVLWALKLHLLTGLPLTGSGVLFLLSPSQYPSLPYLALLLRSYSPGKVFSRASNNKKRRRKIILIYKSTPPPHNSQQSVSHHQYLNIN